MSLRTATPFDGAGLLGFLRPRALPGVELVGESGYVRTLPAALGSGRLLLTVAGAGAALDLEAGSEPVAGLAAQRARRLLDLDADPAAVAGTLSADPLLGPLVDRRPGVRVPGAFDGFEVAVRAVLGQQVSVAGATTLAGRLVRALGTVVAAGDGSAAGPPAYAFPTPERLAGSDLAGIGLTGARAAALRRLGRAVADGEVSLEPGAGPEALLELPGIGPWTAAYIAMRALRDPDAIPIGDLGLRRALERLGADARPGALAARAEGWRPYRAYAAMLLWLS